MSKLSESLPESPLHPAEYCPALRQLLLEQLKVVQFTDGVQRAQVRTHAVTYAAWKVNTKDSMSPKIQGHKCCRGHEGSKVTKDSRSQMLQRSQRFKSHKGLKVAKVQRSQRNLDAGFCQSYHYKIHATAQIIYCYQAYC